MRGNYYDKSKNVKIKIKLVVDEIVDQVSINTKSASYFSARSDTIFKTNSNNDVAVDKDGN